MTPEPGRHEPGKTGIAEYAWVLALSIGLVFGVAIGTLIGDIGAGVALGVSVGVVVGLILVRRLKNTPQ
jgi:hypothetical protein